MTLMLRDGVVSCAPLDSLVVLLGARRTLNLVRLIVAAITVGGIAALAAAMLALPSAVDAGLAVLTAFAWAHWLEHEGER